jgi:hypothetical protein
MALAVPREDCGNQEIRVPVDGLSPNQVDGLPAWLKSKSFWDIYQSIHLPSGYLT